MNILEVQFMNLQLLYLGMRSLARAVSLFARMADNPPMNSKMLTSGVASTELDDAVRALMIGVRDLEAMRRACERMDRMREELRQRIGNVEMAVELIRDARSQ
jgi:hypothetical protein